MTVLVSPLSPHHHQPPSHPLPPQPPVYCINTLNLLFSSTTNVTTFINTKTMPIVSPDQLKSAAIPPSSNRRFPSPCWTHEEILALIDSYREKWFYLRRGNLRASQWQDVADDVIRRCQNLFDSIPPVTIPKTAIQCSHKMEKLRKRYRTERQKSIRFDPTSPTQSTWVYFLKMDALDISPTTGAKRTTPAPTLSSLGEEPSSEQSEEEKDYRGNVVQGRLPSVRFQYKIPKVDMKDTGIPLDSINMGRFFEAKRKLGDKRRREEEVESGDNAIELDEIVSGLRILGEGFMRVERLKMDMNRQFEKVRAEMELKRTEMILNFQQQIIDTFLTGLNETKEKRKKKMTNLISPLDHTR